MTTAFTGGEALVETLIGHGIDTAFCLPGESYLGALESLRAHQNEIRLVVTRHESGASFAACAALSSFTLSFSPALMPWQ